MQWGKTNSNRDKLQTTYRKIYIYLFYWFITFIYIIITTTTIYYLYRYLVKFNKYVFVFGWL